MLRSIWFHVLVGGFFSMFYWKNKAEQEIPLLYPGTITTGTSNTGPEGWIQSLMLFYPACKATSRLLEVGGMVRGHGLLLNLESAGPARHDHWCQGGKQGLCSTVLFVLWPFGSATTLPLVDFIAAAAAWSCCSWTVTTARSCHCQPLLPPLLGPAVKSSCCCWPQN